MGKRSNFARIERDCYDTPLSAVLPLLPHLPENFTYWEPCAGKYLLAQHLYDATKSGAYCAWSTDIMPRSPLVSPMDALSHPDDWLSEFNYCEYIITNPPWDRKILHPMIEHFSALRPTWLLFDAAWAYTRQSSPFMPFCHKIVSVGRVKWFPESKMSGKDDCAWYFFDQSHKTDGVTFYGR